MQKMHFFLQKYLVYKEKVVTLQAYFQKGINSSHY